MVARCVSQQHSCFSIASGCGGYYGEDVDRERTGPLFNSDHMESLCHHPGKGEFCFMQCSSVLSL